MSYTWTYTFTVLVNSLSIGLTLTITTFISLGITVGSVIVNLQSGPFANFSHDSAAHGLYITLHVCKESVQAYILIVKNWQFISPDHSAVIADSWNKRRWVRENFEYYSELELLTWVKCPWLSCLIMEMSVVKGALNKSLTWSSWKPVAEKVTTLWRSCSIYTCLHRVLCQFACAIQSVHLI